MSAFSNSFAFLLVTYIHSCISTNTSLLSYSVENECHVSYDTIGASFNLCPLTIGDDGEQLKYYKVQDIRSILQASTAATDSIYNYFFNVGAELKSVPAICSSTNTTHQYCPQHTDCSGYNHTIEITHTAWVYQVQYDLEGNAIACWALNNGQAPSEWTLIDVDDPSLGIQVTYTNGDYDDSALCKSNRKFHIRFECEDNIRFFIPDEIPLYEYTPCEYTLSVPSQYGCPIECKIYNNHLCSSHGLCAYDNTNSAPRCFCFNKYTGDDCSTFDETAGIAIDSALKAAPSDPFAFTFTDALQSGVDVTYDLGPFAAPQSAAVHDNGGVYVVHDKDYDSDPERKWTYYVAIAKQLKPGHKILPSFCAHIMGPCTEYNGTQCVEYEDDWTDVGLVFQANAETETCFVLGRFTDNSPSFELFDNIDDAARGVTVIYSEGSWCEEAQRNRAFKVHLMCPRDQSAVYDPYNETKVDLYEYVEEEETCVYSFTMESAVACPFQCITNETDSSNPHAFTVCNRQGICAADPEAGFVRCLCDNGWKGVYCTEVDSLQPNISSTIDPNVENTFAFMVLEDHEDDGLFVAIIVMLILLILVLVVVAYVVYRNQKLKIAQQEDEIEFHKMSDRPMIEQDILQSNVIADESGNRNFATIDTTQIQMDTNQNENNANDEQIR